MKQYPHIIVSNPSEHKGKWNQVFNNDHPIHVEVGTGKGQFLMGMGMLHPEVNYIGIEKYDSVIITALERAIESEQPNVKFLNEDVTNILDYFDQGEVDRLFINFTDPWPKNKHEKRRLTYKGFLDLYKQILKPTGEIHFKTDNQGLFEYSLESLSGYGMSLHNVSLDLHKSDIEGNVMTEYEEKFSQKGMRIYRCEAKFR
ncbi:tRNA (guanine46-N7-)-methyltransferase [Halalkalibacter akibai JCM 9157]|uniref:tRNA (guanine-N(7)-)-methyltransferase n=1 Tax=Halalkalibacter akibai (strain ATCC 43226 / DSM 21942 / CIP 109018 / JCM 9157 / 1139) TaxID=1236973 RepID=W4QRB8_HALA3|nr:tRNA (guanosine(46)-N7)-methyltransferase TrmB [Halalkalibacter akibai]GAE34193.1 tRNA (guanine46-N7-)-methyltransferase [Halalkalibacter akibai JCM 9157]